MCVFRKDDWTSGHFYHLKDVCWRDPTEMFVRYKELIRKPDSGVQEPKVLAPFYSKLLEMEELFKVSFGQLLCNSVLKELKLHAFCLFTFHVKVFRILI